MFYKAFFIGNLDIIANIESGQLTVEVESIKEAENSEDVLMVKNVTRIINR